MRRAFFATLPWYDLPEVHAANDAFWAALSTLLVADGIADVPLVLDRTQPYDVDDNGACLFTQTCGYPLLTTARDRFTVLGAAHYTAPGCVGAQHRSYIVVRAGAPAKTTLTDLRGGRFAINEADSNSGMNLPRRLFAPLAQRGRFLGSTVVTGSHAASAATVASGAADAAAIDCITFALLQRYRPDATAALRVMAETVRSPVPPLVTSRHTPASIVEALRRALGTFFAQPRFNEIRAALYLGDFEVANAQFYEPILVYEREAKQLGYAELC